MKVCIFLAKMSHLPLLMSMFPGKIFLTADDIARVMNYSKGHVYNLSSAKKLPFKLDDHGDKIQVSIVAMGKYLDSKLEAPVSSAEISKPVPTLIRKRGRPRNNVSKLQLAFQAQLSLAIIREEVESVFRDVSESIHSIQLNDDEISCEEKIEIIKRDFSLSVTEGRSSLFQSILRLGLKKNESVKVPVEKI